MANRIPGEDLDALDVSTDMEPVTSRRQRLFSVLPTLLTLGNLACGFGAITFAAKVGPTAAYGNELLIAATLVYAAMIFDIFDGSAARLTGQTSEFGAQLDSLCDVVSFGVGPAFLMLQFTLHQSRTEQALSELGLSISPPLVYSSRFLWMAGVLFVICTALRLARFNVETDEDDSHDHFSGLPSPAAAGVIASVPIAMSGVRDLAEGQTQIGQTLAEWLFPLAKTGLPLLALVVAGLMVSRVRYPHFFNQLFRGRRSRRHLLQLIVTLVLIALIPEAVLFLLFTYFAFAGPVLSLWQRFSGRRVLATTGNGEASAPAATSPSEEVRGLRDEG